MSPLQTLVKIELEYKSAWAVGSDESGHGGQPETVTAAATATSIS